MQKGKQSLCFTEAPFIISTANIVGKKEGEGPLAGHFDVIGEDDKFRSEERRVGKECRSRWSPYH